LRAARVCQIVPEAVFLGVVLISVAGLTYVWLH
jgi:hypothetical protein